MADAERNAGWSGLIQAVRTPLGFFALIALILDGVLIVAASSTARLPLWAPLLVLAFLVACVVIIVLVRPEALGDPELRAVTVSLVFPHLAAIDVDLDTDNCRLVVRDRDGHLRGEAKPNLTFGHGGWVCRLTQIGLADSVWLDLKEANGRAWRVKPFTPYETTATASLVS
jgi:hypothetical protein